MAVLVKLETHPWNRNIYPDLSNGQLSRASLGSNLVVLLSIPLFLTVCMNRPTFEGSCSKAMTVFPRLIEAGMDQSDPSHAPTSRTSRPRCLSISSQSCGTCMLLIPYPTSFRKWKTFTLSRNGHGEGASGRAAEVWVMRLICGTLCRLLFSAYKPTNYQLWKLRAVAQHSATCYR